MPSAAEQAGLGFLEFLRGFLEVREQGEQQRRAEQLALLQQGAQSGRFEIAPAQSPQPAPFLQRLLFGQQFQSTPTGQPVVSIGGVPQTLRPVPRVSNLPPETLQAFGITPELAEAFQGVPASELLNLLPSMFERQAAEAERARNDQLFGVTPQVRQRPLPQRTLPQRRVTSAPPSETGLDLEGAANLALRKELASLDRDVREGRISTSEAAPQQESIRRMLQESNTALSQDFEPPENLISIEPSGLESLNAQLRQVDLELETVNNTLRSVRGRGGGADFRNRLASMQRDRTALQRQRESIQKRIDREIIGVEDLSSEVRTELAAQGPVVSSKPLADRVQFALQTLSKRRVKEAKEIALNALVPVERLPFLVNPQNPRLVAPFGLTMSEAQDQGFIIVDPVSLRQLRLVDQGRRLLNKLRTIVIGGVDVDGGITGKAGTVLAPMDLPTGGVGDRIAGTVRIRFDTLNQNADGRRAALYERHLNQYISVFSKGIGSEAGHTSEVDVQRARRGFPVVVPDSIFNLTDTKQLAEEMFRFQSALLRELELVSFELNTGIIPVGAQAPRTESNQAQTDLNKALQNIQGR